MKIVVTGGAGFIGSHVADAYIKAGHKLVVIDNLSKGFRRNVNPRAKFYKADIRDRAAMDRIFKRERPEVVNHHAAIAEVIASLRDPIPTFETNVLGTANLLISFGEYGRGARRKFIFSSTGGAMYGAPKRIPADEKNAPAPQSPYGLSKYLGEETIKYYAEQYGFDHFIFRYANVYGPRQNPKGEAGVVAIFGGLIKRGVRPTIFGDGTKARDYVHVEDIARANLMALRRGHGETANIGRGVLTTDREVFEAIAHALGSKLKPIYAPYRKGEVYRISLDAKKAAKVIGWKPKLAFKEGLKSALRTV